MEKLRQTSLLTKDEFYNDLTQTSISDPEYKFAQDMWVEHKCQTFCDYLQLYLKTDVLLLADVFEQFRDFSLKHYELDAAPFMSAPALSWDILFKYTGVELDLITDHEMFRLIDRGIRGGIVSVVKRHAIVNTPELGEGNNNPDKRKTNLLYVDANNLCGFAICQPMPMNGFRWCTPEELEVLTARFQEGYQPEEGVGYILETDLEYPEELHDEHAEYPLAPELMRVAGEEQSILQEELREAYGIKLTNWQSWWRRSMTWTTMWFMPRT